MKPQTKRKLNHSVQFQFAMYFIALLMVLLVVLNTYPLYSSRNLVISEKKGALVNRAAVVSSSLSLLDVLSPDSARQVMGLLDVNDLTRIMVTDQTGLVLYDTAADNAVGRYALFSEISRALDGKMVFYSHFTTDAFISRAAMPVRSGSRTIGAVYLCEYDAEQAALIVGLQRRLGTITVVVGLIALVIILFSVRIMTRRITRLAEGVRTVQSGDYSFRFEPTGYDELTDLGNELNNLTERLESTEEQRRRFVSDASHELKTPLASIRLLSDSIVQSEEMDPGTMREFVTDIGTEAERLQRTTEKLLNLSRRDDGASGTWTHVDLKLAVEGTLHLLRPLAEQNNIAISCALEEGCVIRATEDDVYHIVFNLVENAIKYNLACGSVSVRVWAQEGRCCLSVEDTGIGIPEADRPNIFARFYRVDKARSREAGGSGLGLSIVHDAVELYGGTVEVGAVEPHGSRFVVSFPRAGEETEI